MPLCKTLPLSSLAVRYSQAEHQKNANWSVFLAFFAGSWSVFRLFSFCSGNQTMTAVAWRFGSLTWDWMVACLNNWFIQTHTASSSYWMTLQAGSFKGEYIISIIYRWKLLVNFLFTLSSWTFVPVKNNPRCASSARSLTDWKWKKKKIPLKVCRCKYVFLQSSDVDWWLAESSWTKQF